MALYYKANGEFKIIYPQEMPNYEGKPESSFALKDMQDLVGGYCQLIYLGESGLFIGGVKYSYILVDEDGRMNEKPINAKVTEYYQHVVGGSVNIVGDALLLERHEMD